MGITPQIMREAMEQARRGRLFLLDTMDAVISKANEEKSEFAPRIETIMIPTDKIRDLIGPGGKVIRGIVEATGAKIDVDDTGRVNVASSDRDGLARAMQMVQDITAVPEIGKTYLGKVVRLAEFGAFVEIFPGTDGLLHISEIAEHRVAKVEDELRDGDQILVKVIALEGNRIKLSRKAVLKEQRAALGLPDPEPEQGGGGDRGGRGGDRGGRSDRGDRGPRGGGSQGGSQGNDQQPRSNASTITIEGGDDFEDDDNDAAGEEGDEPNFNREGAAGTPGTPAAGGERRPGGGGNRRRRGGRRGGPGGGGNAGGGNNAGGNR